MGLREIQKLKEEAKLPKEKKFYKIPPISKKRQAKINQEKENGTDIGLDKFFLVMRKKCKGKCFFCGGATTYKNEDLWTIAIAHLFPKSKFKSVATCEENWVELCWDCHTKFDTGMISWELLKDNKEWEVLKEKLLIVLPKVIQPERKYKLYDKLINLVYKK